MKATLLSDNLVKKITFLGHAVSGKNQLPILSNILIEAKKGKLILSTTDLEIGIIVKIPASVEKEGAVTVPAKTFSDLIGSILSEKITLETKDQNLELKGNKIKTVFQTMPHEDFPRLYEEKGEELGELKKEVIEKDFVRVVFSASLDSARPALSGVLIAKEKGNLLTVATDGYRLSLKKGVLITSKKDKIEKPLLVPARVIREALFIKDEGESLLVFVSDKTNQILFSQGDTILVGRLIEAEYPPYEKIIPTDFSTKTEFEREDFQNAVKVCAVFARETANIIKLAIKKDKIVVSANSPSVGENTVEVDAKTQGEENEIAFNARYLLDLLSNVDDDSFVFEMTGPLNPGVFKIKDDPSFLHLIMPIRVQG